MDASVRMARSVLFGIAGFMFALLSAFFVFYEARLLYVTHWLTAIRGGGRGAYIGAIVFPLLAIVFGLVAWRCVRAARRSAQ